MIDNPLDRIQSYYDELTKNERNIAVQIINDPQTAATLTIDALAEKYGTSKAALVRFAKHIGYTGFAEFHFDLSRFLVSQNAPASSHYKDTSPIQAITQAYCDYIQEINQFVTLEQIQHIAQLFLSANKRKLFGRNRTYSAARQLQLRLARMGYDTESIDDHTLALDIVNMLNDKDLVILFTISDHTKSYDSIVKTLNENTCPIVCITMSQDLSFKKYCTEYVVLPRISRSANMSFLDDQAINFVFIEILLDAIAIEAQKQA